MLQRAINLNFLAVRTAFQLVFLMSEIVHLCLIACSYGFWDLISFFFRWLHM